MTAAATTWSLHVDESGSFGVDDLGKKVVVALALPMSAEAAEATIGPRLDRLETRNWRRPFHATRLARAGIRYVDGQILQRDTPFAWEAPGVIRGIRDVARDVLRMEGVFLMVCLEHGRRECPQGRWALGVTSAIEEACAEIRTRAPGPVAVEACIEQHGRFKAGEPAPSPCDGAMVETTSYTASVRPKERAAGLELADYLAHRLGTPGGRATLPVPPAMADRFTLRILRDQIASAFGWTGASNWLASGLGDSLHGRFVIAVLDRDRRREMLLRIQADAREHRLSENAFRACYEGTQERLRRLS